MDATRTVEEKKAELLLQLTKSYGIIRLACRRARVGPTMFYEYKNSDPVFAFKVNEIVDSFVDLAETRLYDMVLTGDRAAIMFYLKAKGKGRGYM